MGGSGRGWVGLGFRHKLRFVKFALQLLVIYTHLSGSRTLVNLRKGGQCCFRGGYLYMQKMSVASVQPSRFVLVLRQFFSLADPRSHQWAVFFFRMQRCCR